MMDYMNKIIETRVPDSRDKDERDVGLYEQNKNQEKKYMYCFFFLVS